MNCDWTEKISLLVDGELPAGEARAAAETHLRACAACQHAREDFLYFRHQLAGYRADFDPATQRQALEAILGAKASAAPAVVRPATNWRERLTAAAALGVPRFAPAAATLALVLVALVAGMFVYLNSRETAQQTAGGDQPGAPTRREDAGTNDRPAETVGGQSGAAQIEKGPTSSGGGDMARQPKDVVAANDETSGRRRPSRPFRRKTPADVRNAKQLLADGAARDQTPALDGRDTIVSASAADAGVTRDGREPATPAPLNTARHAEQAQLLLRAFRHARLTNGGRGLDYERSRSKKLLYQNIVLRREAANSCDEPAEELLDRLEPILIDIANLPERPAREEVSAITERMRKKNIVVMLQAGAAAKQRSY
ncbi:MAG: anti-sigma factor family protein [Pyrinomonadaceae bacterium]